MLREIFCKNFIVTVAAFIVEVSNNTEVLLLLQIYSHRPLLRDIFLGQVGIPAPLNHEPTLLRTELLLDDNTEGSLELYVLTDDNFLRV